MKPVRALALPAILEKWCGVTVMLRAGSMSTGVTVQVASLAIYRRVLDFEIGTAGGYRAHICGFWRPVHCLSATAVLYWRIFRSAIQGHGDGHATVHSPKVTPLVTVLRALEWQISLVLR